MLFIETNSLNPYFNLAAEEYLVQNKSEEIFMLWRNSKSVIVGRNQNAMAEVDYNFVTEKNIAVVRRMSGGGAVFHDDENINYTYIVNTSENTPQFGNYEAFTKMLINYLGKLGIKGELSGRNDVTVEGRKISGNAQYKWHSRLMHHGTILIGADISALSKALTPDESKIQSKGIKSVKSRVANINEFADTDAERFFEGFKAEILASGATEYVLTENETAEINKLVAEKYSTFEWNWGYSPKYNFSKKQRFLSGGVEVCLSIENGIIKETKIYGDFFSAGGIDELEAALSGIRHDKAEVTKIIENVWKENIIGNISAEEFVECMF